jgi:hypothetical protein
MVMVLQHREKVIEPPSLSEPAHELGEVRLARRIDHYLVVIDQGFTEEADVDLPAPCEQLGRRVRPALNRHERHSVI